MGTFAGLLIILLKRKTNPDNDLDLKKGVDVFEEDLDDGDYCEIQFSGGQNDLNKTFQTQIIGKVGELEQKVDSSLSEVTLNCIVVCVSS